MSGQSAADAAAEMLAGTEVGGDFVYLSKRGTFGRYELEISALKFVKGGKPCIEAKVVKAEKTQKDSEPHRVGTVVSHLEDIADEKKGGRQRLMRMMLAASGLTKEDIATAQEVRGNKTVELEGKNAERKWLVKLLDQGTQPLAFARVGVEIEPRETENGTFSKERWFPLDLTDADLDDIDAKREAAQLPTVAEALGMKPAE